jgi:hypothetical protein
MTAISMFLDARRRRSERLGAIAFWQWAKKPDALVSLFRRNV